VHALDVRHHNRRTITVPPERANTILVGPPAALSLRRFPHSRSRYRSALDAAGKIRFGPGLALKYLRLAELLPLQQSDNVADSQGLEHLGFQFPRCAT
jgi:hypothetical protein